MNAVLTEPVLSVLPMGIGQFQGSTFRYWEGPCLYYFIPIFSSRWVAVLGFRTLLGNCLCFLVVFVVIGQYHSLNACKSVCTLVLIVLVNLSWQAIFLVVL